MIFSFPDELKAGEPILLSLSAGWPGGSLSDRAGRGYANDVALGTRPHDFDQRRSFVASLGGVMIGFGLVMLVEAAALLIWRLEERIKRGA